MENKKSANDSIKEYAKAEFDKIDKEKKGYISTSDFADIIYASREKANLPPPNDMEMAKIMKSLDPERTGHISFESWFKFLRMGKKVADAAAKQQKEKEQNK